MTKNETVCINVGDTIFFCDCFGDAEPVTVIAGDSLMSHKSHTVGIVHVQEYPECYATKDTYRQKCEYNGSLYTAYQMSR